MKINCYQKESVSMGLQRGWFYCLFFCFWFLACQPEPGAKKHPRSDNVKVDQSFFSVHKPEVDILFVIDDSQSMKLYQDLLARNASAFIHEFFKVQSVDYHIGVTTSSTEEEYSKGISHIMINPKMPMLSLPSPSVMDGVLVEVQANHKKHKYVHRDIHNGDEILRKMMKVGANGSDKEYFIGIPEMSLSNKKNHGFYREEAHLVIFVITDTDDQSLLNPKDSYEFLVDLKGDEKKLHYAAIIIPSDIELSRDDKCQRDGHFYGFLPIRIEEMVGYFGDRGYLFNLCQDDYGEGLAKVAHSVVKSVLTVALSGNKPEINSIKVSFRKNNGQRIEIPNGTKGWTYDAGQNVIHLSRDMDLGDIESGETGEFGIKYDPIYIPDYHHNLSDPSGR